MTDIEREIGDAASLLGLLLAFAFGYLAALLPTAIGLLHEPKPSVDADRDALATRLRTFAWLHAGVALFAVLLGSVLTPLTTRVLRRLLCGSPYSTVAGALLLFDVMLISLVVVNAILAIRLARRARRVR